MPDLILVVVDVVVFGSCSWGKVNGTQKKKRVRSFVFFLYFSISISYIIITEAEKRRVEKKKVKRNSIHINRTNTKNRRMKKVFLRVKTSLK
jgi:hypothetical protein